MLSFEIRNTTVHLLPLLMAFLIAVIGGVFHARLLSKRNRDIVELCQAGKYNDSIVLAQKQLNYYKRKLKTQNTKSVMERIYLHIAISYFGLSNDEQFIHNMTQVTDLNPEKHFWLALFYLTKDELDEFEKEYEILTSIRANKKYLSYLSCMRESLEFDDVETQTALSALKSILNFKLLQDISQIITTG